MSHFACGSPPARPLARRIATRYDKLAEIYMAMIKLASIRVWLRAYASNTNGSYY